MNLWSKVLKPDTVSWQPPLPVEDSSPAEAETAPRAAEDEAYRRGFAEGREAALSELKGEVVRRLERLESEAKRRMAEVDERIRAYLERHAQELVELSLAVVASVLSHGSLPAAPLIARIRQVLDRYQEGTFRTLTVPAACRKDVEAAFAPLGLEVRAGEELSGLSFYLEGPELSLDATLATALREIEDALREALGREELWSGGR